MYSKSNSPNNNALLPPPVKRPFLETNHTFVLGKFVTGTLVLDFKVGLSLSEGDNRLVVFKKDSSGNFDAFKTYEIDVLPGASDDGFVGIRFSLESNGDYVLKLKSGKHSPSSPALQVHHLTSDQDVALCPLSGTLYFIGADDIRTLMAPTPCAQLNLPNRDPNALTLRVNPGEVANIRYVDSDDIQFHCVSDPIQGPLPS